MSKFLSWLRHYNNSNNNNSSPPSSSFTYTQQQRRQRKRKVQILGMDIQTPFDSIHYILQQLEMLGEVDLVTFVREAYTPLLRYESSSISNNSNIRQYGNDVYGNKIVSQERAVMNALDAIVDKYNEMIIKGCTDRADGTSNNNSKQLHTHDSWYKIIHNAHVIVASEAFHRQRIYPGHTTTWNIRTRSMFDSILRYNIKHGQKMNRLSTTCTDDEDNADVQHQPMMRIIVWAHNSHVGDMRSTGYASLGQISLGQLCREMFGNDNVFIIGMTTYEGTVRAAIADGQGACWQGSGHVMQLRKAMDGSHESILHSIVKEQQSSFGLYLHEHDNQELLFNYCNNSSNRLERFVGSCYLPQTEMMSHYTSCNLDRQYDYMFHVDNSTAIAV